MVSKITGPSEAIMIMTQSGKGGCRQNKKEKDSNDNNSCFYSAQINRSVMLLGALAFTILTARYMQSYCVKV